MYSISRFERKWAASDSVSQSVRREDVPQQPQFQQQPTIQPEPQQRRGRGLIDLLRSFVPTNRDDSDEDVESQVCRPVHNPTPQAVAAPIRQVGAITEVHISQVALSINGINFCNFKILIMH